MRFTLLLLSFIASTATAAPLQKRIAQVISSSTTFWEKACDAAGGGEQCNPVAVNSFETLLAAAGPCDQQNAADNMIDLAKTLQNNADVITFAQLFAQQPRNSPSSQSVQYCQQAPRNAELDGLFQCQFKGDNPTVFVGGVPVGQSGTIPFGHSQPLSPSGSCPANPSGPIADGTQLTDITKDPGVPSSGTSATPAASSTPAATDTAAAGAAATPTDTTPGTCGTAAANPPAATSQAADTSTGGGFALKNGQDAQKLNAQFAKLTPDSSCTAGQDACINGGFAQCVAGKFTITPCGATLICAALPLVEKPGTSIACTTSADATSRIAATGASGGITG
jgi:hypothetical protein